VLELVGESRAVNSKQDKIDQYLAPFAKCNYNAGYLLSLPTDDEIQATILRAERNQRDQTFPHARTRYAPLELCDYERALVDIAVVRQNYTQPLNFHIPDEIQFASRRDIPRGLQFMNHVERVAIALGVGIVWENSAILDPDSWEFRENQSMIPAEFSLCLDIGHLMLGSKSQAEAIDRIDQFMESYGNQVRHLHLHINDFMFDRHWNQESSVVQFLGQTRFTELVTGRTYIFEKGE
jgi:hypothetical protein